MNALNKIFVHCIVAGSGDTASCFPLSLLHLVRSTRKGLL